MNTLFSILIMIMVSAQVIESPYYYDDDFRFSFKHDDPGGNLIINAYFEDDPWYGGRKPYGEKWEPFRGRNHISVNASILVKEVNGWLSYERIGGTPLLLHLPSGIATIQAEYENQWIIKDVAIFPNETTTIEFVFNEKNPTKQWYYLFDRVWLEYRSLAFSFGLMFAYILVVAIWSRFKKKSCTLAR